MTLSLSLSFFPAPAAVLLPIIINAIHFTVKFSLLFVGTKRWIVRGRAVRVSIARSVETRLDWRTGDV